MQRKTCCGGTNGGNSSSLADTFRTSNSKNGKPRNWQTHTHCWKTNEWAFWRVISKMGNSLEYDQQCHLDLSDTPITLKHTFFIFSGIFQNNLGIFESRDTLSPVTWNRANVHKIRKPQYGYRRLSHPFWTTRVTRNPIVSFYEGDFHCRHSGTKRNRWSWVNLEWFAIKGSHETHETHKLKGSSG